MNEPLDQASTDQPSRQYPVWIEETAIVVDFESNPIAPAKSLTLRYILTDDGQRLTLQNIFGQGARCCSTVSG